MKYKILILYSIFCIIPANAHENGSNSIFKGVLAYFTEGLETEKWYCEEVSKTIKEDSITENCFTDIFEIKDIINNKRVFNESELNKDFGIYEICFSPLSHSPRHMLLISNNQATLYKSESMCLLQDVINLYDCDTSKISEKDVITVIKYVLYPFGNKKLYRMNTIREKICDIEYVND